jgi:FSR family fosmidomycin resistance protein-like MFS transporter
LHPQFGSKTWTDLAPARRGFFLALSLVHFTGDFYAALLTPLLPFFVDKLRLTLSQVGRLAGISNFLTFVVQPSASCIAHHYHTRAFILGGPLLAACRPYRS